jgi:C-terminal processing protease CtpA/Prc
MLNSLCLFALACLLSSIEPNICFADETQNTDAAKNYKHGIVGLKFVVREQRVPKIAAVYPDTPAEAAGIRPGDEIISIDGIPAKNMTMREIFDRLTGKPGTTVDLCIEREQRELVVKLKRAKLNTLDTKHPGLVKDYLQSPVQ